MRPYGISLKDRRRMYDYGADKYNSRGCFNHCDCHICRNKKSKIRKDTSRAHTSNLNVINRMRAAKKHQRQIFKTLLKKEITANEN